MNKEKLCMYINENIVNNATFYSSQNIPSQIGNAIYLYGDNDILDIVAFIDSSFKQDGSLGMIITPDKIYFQFDQAGSFAYQDIQSLSLEKHRHDTQAKGIITTQTNSYIFDNYSVYVEELIKILSRITDIDIEMILTSYEKVEYYVSLVLDDILNDEYEDVILTPSQTQQIHEFKQELQTIHSLDNENYQYELELLCPRALKLFDELELDSDEIDILWDVQKEFEQKQQKEEQMFDQAKHYYDDMMNQYRQGDTKMYDQIKSMMNMMGINEDDIKGKSPEEMNQYLEDLCARFGISKSQVEALARKFNLKQ